MLKSVRVMKWLPAIITVIVASALASCSLSKNTAATRRYTEFITRYNIYFNGDQHFKETLAQMERDYPDDYTRLLPVHPVDAYANDALTNPTGSFDRSIEKAQKAIELRSIKKRPRRKAGKSNDPEYKAWLKRGEYNPFLQNAWLMMGRSQMYNGDFLSAATTFAYVAKNFPWLPATVAEAQIYQARCYAAMGWTFEAENMLRRVKIDELHDRTLHHLYNLVAAECLIQAGRYAEAVEPLRRAVDTASGTQKTRLTFLLGQVLERAGDRAAAFREFGRVAGSNSAPYPIKFNARIKQSEVYTGANIEPEVKSLRSMLRYDRNREYADQIYYAIGNLYLSRGDTLRAIDNYRLAVEKSTRGGIDQALARLSLGALYFARRDYDKAQPLYSEAVPLLPSDYPDLQQIRRRSDLLDELAVYAGNVALQDSLLRLSAMTPDEQMAVATRLADELKKREAQAEEEARRADFEANAPDASQSAPGGSAEAPSTFTMNNDRSWYFYNTTVRNAGKAEFQRRWGSRKLEDDWRRRNKSSFSFSEIDGSTDEETGEDLAEGVDSPTDQPIDSALANRTADPHYPEYYLAQIPKTDIERATAHEVIQEGRYNMGLILKDKLEDFPAAETQWAILLRDYPDNIYRLDTYFNLYLMYMRLGDAARAEQYRQLILNDFAESEPGLVLRDPLYIEHLREMDSRQDRIYADAYDAYLAGDTAAVRTAAAEMTERYPMSPLLPKIMFLDALTYVPDADEANFSSRLRTLLERYPDADVSPVASAYMRDLARGRRLAADGGSPRAMVWDMRLSNDSLPDFDSDEAIAFDINDQSDPLLILVYSTDSVSPNRLQFDVARHNFSTFNVKDYELEQMNFGHLGLLVISGFTTLPELEHYRSTLSSRGEAAVVPPQARPVVISRKNFDLLLRSGRSFDHYFRAIEAARVDSLEDRFGLPPEQVEEQAEKQ